MDSGGREMPNRPVRLWQAILSAVMVLIVLFFCGFWYVNRVVQQSNHRWCGLLVLLDDRNQKAPAPPPTPEGQESQRFRDEIHGLRISNHC